MNGRDERLGVHVHVQRAVEAAAERGDCIKQVWQKRNIACPTNQARTRVTKLQAQVQGRRQCLHKAEIVWYRCDPDAGVSKVQDLVIVRSTPNHCGMNVGHERMQEESAL